MNSSKIAVLVLALSACTSPKGAGLFEPPADSDAGAGGEASDAGASSSGGTGGGAAAGASGASGTSGTAGGGGMAAAGGGGGVAGSATSGSSSAAGTGAGVSGGGAASAGGGGASGAGGGGMTGTGGLLSKCELMAVQANAALAIAQSCNALADHAYCTGYIKNECGCQVPVDVADSDLTATYVKQRDAYLADCKPTCTAACTEPASQTCRIMGGFATGTCVATPK